MNTFSKALAASAAALAIGAVAAPAQSAVYIGYDVGGGIVEDASYGDGPFAYTAANLGGWEDISIEGVANPIPSLLHSEVVNLNNSGGAASITLYVTRTGLDSDDLVDFFFGNKFQSGFSFAALGNGFSATTETYIDDGDGKFTGALLASDSFSGTTSQASNFTNYVAGLTGTVSVTHKYVVTATGKGSVSPDITLSAAVPEPGTWALMIMGFGGAGAMLRSRRKAMVAA